MLPVRWHVHSGALWVNDSMAELDTWGMTPEHEGPLRYELGELIKGRRVTVPGGEDHGNSHPRGFVAFHPIRERRYFGGQVDFRPVVEYDLLPCGPFQTRLFVVSNVGGSLRGETKAGGLGAAEVHITPEEEKTPRWSFAGHSVRCRYKVTEWAWKSEGWVEECTIDVGIREPFQALGRGDDYYFLTSSGKLYRAPKPTKGTHRKLEVVWNDAHSPVTAFVQDADRERTFLFCEVGPPNQRRPALFELAPRVRLREYDPALFRLGDQGPEALRRVVGHARVLTALKLVRSSS
ncbi:MAG: hypothetical protein U0840_31030 [Gemmataceae bacterium]